MEKPANKDNQKTLIYVLVAGMALLVAWEPWRPAPPDHSAPREVGTKLFSDYKDPLAAKSLEVTKFDEDTATIRPFKVAQVNGVWSIPSHNNYPADAQDHMAAAATSLLDLTILSEVSRKAGDQALYGVITPDPKTLSQGATGVGTRVTLRDDKDKVLADLIIGKAVKDQPALHYVREEGRDPIYAVAVKTDQFSTKFDDWIEKDLLKLNAFDVRNVELNDYSIEQGLTQSGQIGLRMHPRSKAKLAFDEAKSSWSLVQMTEYDDKQQEKPAQLAENEELNTDKLNALKTALDDLKIVDVERKPKGLSQDLRASEELVKDPETQASLIGRGFYPVPVEGHTEIFSSEGEATCTTKDGVRYVLRFGSLSGDVASGEGKEPPKEGEEPKADPSMNRYLFVMAQFDESQIPKPELKPLPDQAKPAEAKPEDKPAEEKSEGDKPAEAPATDKPAEPAADKPADAPEAKEPAAEAPPETKTAAQEEEKANEEAPAAESKESKPAEAKSDAEAAKPAEAPAETKSAVPTPEEQAKVAVERENKRLQEEYDTAIKNGQNKVKELNDRFADWYFIISDDVYKKIHLGRGDIVKVKVAEDAVKELGNPALNELQKGLQGK